ncbi:MAG: lysylphosphatidylglycerol synthase transmembrane domain-containing protein [Anaerolineales bacterium]
MKRWQFWAGIVISAVFLWLAMRGLKLADVWQSVREANYFWLLPGIAAYMLAVWARAWRWHYLLRPLKRVPVSAIFPIVAIGYMGNNIYPARAGELLRAYVLRRRQQIPISASLATIIVERAFDGIVMLAFVFANLPELARVAADSRFAGSIQDLAIWGAAIFAAAVLAFLLMALNPKPTLRLVGWLLDRLLPAEIGGRALDMAERFIGGLESLRSAGDVSMVLLSSIVIWLLETGKYWLVMHAFPFQVSFFALMLMNGIVNLATTIPSAPGYVGTFDAPGIAVLEAYGVPSGIAAGYTLVLHAALWLPITLLGAYYMARESLSWDRVQQEMAEEGVA